MSITISANHELVGSLYSSMMNQKNSAAASHLFSSSTDLLGINYSDYASIRGGSYHKLLSAYYEAQNETKQTGTVTHTRREQLEALANKNEQNGSTSISKDKTETLSKIQSAAEKLGDTADALMTDGRKKEFDSTKAYEKVQAFTEAYNSLLKETEKSNTKGVTNAITSMKQNTKWQESLLQEIGITIDDKTEALSIDKDTFMKADLSKVKDLFVSQGAYGYQTAVKASMAEYQAQREASKANTYNQKGNYSFNYNSGAIWEQLT